MTKFCTVCHLTKDINCFGRNSRSKDGYHYVCKECHNKNGKQFKQRNKDKIRKQSKIYHQTHKQKIKRYRKIYRKANKEKISQQTHKYYEINKNLESFWLNKPENKLKVKNYQIQYKQKTKQVRNKKEKDKRNTNLGYKILLNLRSRINLALKENWKSGHTLELLGCSVEFLKKHLEAQFTNGMSWNNYTRFGWHVDHIKPCVKFDLTDPKQQEQCFHYTNLQPLWWRDNLIKRDKYE